MEALPKANMRINSYGFGFYYIKFYLLRGGKKYESK